jgi:hypothetical protein
MNPIRTSDRVAMQIELVDPRDEAAVATSRRDMLRRLAALGLVAASGTALASGDAEGKSKRRGQNKGRGKERERKQERRDRGQDGESGGGGQGESPEPNIGFMASEGRHGRAWNAPVVNGANTTYPLLSIPTVTSSSTILVTVSGYFNVSSTDLAQMRGGLQYALTCAIKEQDGSSYTHCFTFTDSGGNETKFFGTAFGTTTAGRKFFSFSQVVSRSVLNKDTASGDYDEVLGQVFVYGRQTASNGWFQLATRNTQIRAQRY